MSLIRWNPYDDMRQTMDRMMAQMQSMMEMPFIRWNGSTVNSLAVDMTSDDKQITVRAALPGFNEDEVSVDVRGNMLTISAETKAEREDHNANWYMREMRYGKFMRSVALPEDVVADKAEATLENGILTVNLPKQRPSPVQRIAIKARNLLRGGKKD